jgi:hypothetical protein
MISDRKAMSVRRDGDDCVIAFEGDAPRVGAHPQLLLDARGKLVGVDLGGDGFDRVAIMIGAHESVAKTIEARVSVAAGSLRVVGGANVV